MPFTADEFHDLIRKQAFAGVKPAPKAEKVECWFCAGTGCCDMGPEPMPCANCRGRGYVVGEA